MRVGIFGNNLNAGYILAQLLRPHFESVKLLLTEQTHQQEQHHWWTDQRQWEELVTFLPRPPMHLAGKLTSLDLVRQWYDEARRYDVLLLSEDGPAFFSELEGPRKILVSYGYDMQDLPFFCQRQFPKAIDDCFRNEPKRELDRGNVLGAAWRAVTAPLRVAARAQLYLRIQRRQRTGLHACDALVCWPYQKAILQTLRLDERRVRCIPLPMDCDVLGEVDESFARELREQFADHELLLFHPTRQWHTAIGGDIYTKDNLKLIRGFDRFLKESPCRARLLLVRKGAEADISAAERLIADLGRERSIQWFPEMPNKRLRAYYTLPNAVVCDQFSPNLPMLGNVGREASFFGRLLVTAFHPSNSELYGADMPPHVFPSETETEVALVLHKISKLSAAERAALGAEGRGWFDRQHAAAAVEPKWLALIDEVAGGRGDSRDVVQDARSKTAVT